MKIDNVNPNLLIVGGLGVAAYFGVLSPIFELFGIKKSKDDKKNEQDLKISTTDTVNQLKATGIKQTLSDMQLKNIADTVHEALRYSALDDKDSRAVAALCQLGSDLDFALIVKYYGIRQECYFGAVCYDRTLSTLVTKNLSENEVKTINTVYAKKGMKSRF